MSYSNASPELYPYTLAAPQRRSASDSALNNHQGHLSPARTRLITAWQVVWCYQIGGGHPKLPAAERRKRYLRQLQRQRQRQRAIQACEIIWTTSYRTQHQHVIIIRRERAPADI
jgi:hypothetical protein